MNHAQRCLMADVAVDAPPEVLFFMFISAGSANIARIADISFYLVLTLLPVTGNRVNVGNQYYCQCVLLLSH